LVLASPARLWGAVLLASIAIGAAAWPIFPHDGDLWYHLASGRFIAQRHALPTTAFFSVLPAAAGWVDYYWLFQLLVYALQAAGGYGALVLLRAALLVALAVIVFVHVRRSGRPGGRFGGWQAVLATLALLAVLPRFSSLRPHLFSLLLLATFLLVLEHLPRAVPALLPLGVLWTNLHGIEYPVLLLALGAWAAPLLLELVRSRALPSSATRRRLAWLALAALAPLLTPNGLRLLPVPFQSVAFVRHAILEMAPFDFAQLPLVPAHGLTAEIAFVALLVLAAAALVDRAAQRTLALPHLLLAAGGAVLLFRGSRFVVELSLLLVPLVAAWRPPALIASAALRRAAAAAFAIAALVGLHDRFVTHRRWPLDAAALPSGVSRFLARAGSGGVVLAYPDLAGWFEWTLYPRYRIFGDLQAYLFDERSLFLTGAPFADSQVLGTVAQRLRPDWIAAPASGPGFERMTAVVGGYEPVAFDWTMVLYARRAGHEAIARQWALDSFDPYHPAGPLRPPQREQAARELERLHALDPRNSAVATALARARLTQGRAHEALQLATEAKSLAPARPEPWTLFGESLAANGRQRDALAAYDTAEDRGAAPLALGRLRWAAWTRLGDPERAYAAFEPVASPLAGETSWTDLWGLAESARADGDAATAERLLVLAWWKAPPGPPREQLAAALAELRSRPR
jgi:hypothetical protein